jgi:2-amino-4-hydroxy-6-hydroxymethyldihydropteridine diphosphokinase
MLLNDYAGQVILVSSIYETEPWGHTHEINFFNQVVSLHTRHNPSTLLESIHQIEILCGRKRSGIQYAPRIIDIDILFYNDRVITSENLTIPHKQMHLRRFVLEPMAEIAPMYKHPLTGRTMKEMLEICTDEKKVVRWSEAAE